MKFIQPCFIRKNTSKLRNRLEEFGYLPPSEIWYDENFAICTIYRDNKREYLTFKIDDDFERTIVPSYSYIDCGENEELFLALAALDRYSDYMQWFTDGTEWYQNRQNDIEVIRYGAGSPINFHKATVNELIDHFKNK